MTQRFINLTLLFLIITIGCSFDDSSKIKFLYPLSTLASTTTSTTNNSSTVNLSNLTISSVSLFPVFSSTTTTYSATVQNSISTVTVTPTASDSTFTITVNGTTVSSGSSSSSITLNTGSNTISVIVSSSSGLSTTYTITIVKLANNKFRIFVTNSTYTGDLSAISGADAKCNSDSYKPNDGSTFKAVIVNVNANRRACSTSNCAANNEGIDWVLGVNKDYFRASDGVAVFSTGTNKIFQFGTLSAALDSGSQKKFWTGLTTDWTTLVFNAGSGQGTCNSWGSSSSSRFSNYGVSDSTGSSAISSGTNNCDNAIYLLCAEQ